MSTTLTNIFTKKTKKSLTNIFRFFFWAISDKLKQGTLKARNVNVWISHHTNMF